MVTDESASTELIAEVTGEFEELRQAADLLDEAVAAQVGLNRTDLRCLGIIYRRGRLTAGELAEESGLTPGAITTVLDRMERAGFANRVPTPPTGGACWWSPRPRPARSAAACTARWRWRRGGSLEGTAPRSSTVIRDYLRRLRDVYEGQAAHIAEARRARAAAPPSTAREPGRARGVGAARRRHRGAPRVHQGRGQGRHPRRRRAGRAVPRPLRGPAAGRERQRRRRHHRSRRRFRPFDWRGQSARRLAQPAIPGRCR